MTKVWKIRDGIVWRWAWTATHRPPQRERVTMTGRAMSKSGAFRAARRSLQRIVETTS